MTRFLVIEFSALTRGSACPRRGCRSGSATRCSPGQPGDAPGRRGRTSPLPPPWPSSSHSKSHPFCSPEHWLLSQSRSKPACTGKSGCTICFAFPTDKVLWASFVPREGAALMAPCCRDGTLLASGLGAALLGQAFPNLSPNPGKAVL